MDASYGFAGSAGSARNGTGHWSGLVSGQPVYPFFSNGKLKKIDLLAGLPQTLCDAQGFVTGTWSEDGVIVFANRDVLYRVPATGGQPAKLTELDASKQETAHFHPVFLQ